MKQPPKTKKEAAQRLIDGEQFDRGGERVWFDEGCINPFRIGEVGITDGWSEFQMWQPIPEWHESLSPENKRFCWVSDRDPNVKDNARWIAGKDSLGFIAKKGRGWRFATPVLPEHLEHD